MTFRDRITELRRVKASDLTPHPKNYRTHPTSQRSALSSVLDQVGFADALVVRETPDGLQIVDGHLRADVAADQEVPVLVVDVDDLEAELLLASLDPIAAMAEHDEGTLRSLLVGLATQDDALSTMFDELLADAASTGSDTQAAKDARVVSANLTLAERFGVPPFSVLDARQGYWMTRKRAWLNIGLQSELGRPGARAFAPHEVLGEGASTGLTITSNSGRDPDFYAQKRRVERELGREISTAEFERDHYENQQSGGGLSAAGTSVFDPVLAELVYRWYSPPGGRVLDPFAGGSVRGVVAGRLGRTYLGIDLSGEQIEANKPQAVEILRPTDPEPTWIQGDSRVVLASGDIGDGYDLLFSCPPYFDLEVYGDDPADLSTMDWPAFLEGYREIIRLGVGLLAPDAFACFVVGEVRSPEGPCRGLIPETIRAFEDAGARLYNDAVLVTSAGSLPVRAGRAFESGRKLGRTHQAVLVFARGDWRAAVERLGSTEYADPLDEPEVGA